MANAIYYAHMTAKLTIDKAGRVIIPKPVRDELHLSSGDSLEIKSSRDEIVLRPVREKPRMIKESGFWVFQSGKTISQEETDAILLKIREERDAQNLGQA